MVDYQVHAVSYVDTPGFFSEKWKDYEAPPRTYDSQLVDFGFDMDYKKGVIRDIRFDNHYDEEAKQPATSWVSVGVQSNNDIMSRPEHLNVSLEEDLKFKPDFLAGNYVKIPEIQYGLQQYVVPDKNPETGEPLDFGYLPKGDDLFVAFDEDGNVRSYIKCSYKWDVPRPPCRHRSRIIQDGLAVTLSIGYSRRVLQDWQKIEAEAEKIVWSFVKNAEDDLKKQQPNQPNRSK